MSSQYLTLYKMIVLYMLKRCEVPLSKSQIYDFILEKEYTTFLTLQEVFSELAASHLINEKTVANRTYLEITDEGDETLKFFGNRINPSIRQQIDEYLKKGGNHDFRNFIKNNKPNGLRSPIRLTSSLCIPSESQALLGAWLLILVGILMECLM